ncbi:MAG: hypothetical protein P8K79_13215 [Mariniblastus sp.]|nr:hypothetical protein [Mariniblastus sp.]
MFANEDFIDASRKFVCIRIETYENKESEEKVRALLNGAFANTAFCLFDPEGEERLSRAGRGPSMGLGGRGGRGERGEQASGDAGVIQRMNQIAAKYSPKGQKEDVTLQDFNSFRQALNVASADQRLLVFLNAENSSGQPVEAELKQVFADSEVVGKFHLKLKDETMDENWSKVVQGATDKPGILIIRSGTFGLEGQIVEQLPISSNAKEIKSAMLNANKSFAAREDRKTYRDHVTSGRRQGIYFENEIPYGEDRDGDGKIDNQRRGRRK